MNRLMIVLATIVGLAIMTYITNLNAYELHMEDGKIFNGFVMNLGNLHYTYDRCSLLFKSVCVSYVNDYICM